MLKFLCFVSVFGFATSAFAGAGDHHFGLFGGITKKGNTGYSTIGGDYEYGLTDWLGLGVTGESISTDPVTTVALGMVSLYPFLGLRLFAGAGQESAGGHSETIRRVGGSYTIHLGPLFLTPMIAHDAIGSGGNSSDTVGLSIGLGI